MSTGDLQSYLFVPELPISGDGKMPNDVPFHEITPILIEYEDADRKSVSGQVLHETSIPVRAMTNFSAQYMKDRHAYIYRKMSPAEASDVINSNQFSYIKGSNQRKYFSESFDKVWEFQNRGVPESERAAQQVMEVSLDKKYYRIMKRDAVPQFQASKLHNEYHFEGIIKRGDPLYPVGGFTNREAFEQIPGSVERNYGICKAGIPEFNNKMTGLKVISSKNQAKWNSVLRTTRKYVSRGLLCLQVAIEVGQIVIAVMNDGGRFGKQTTLTLSNIAAGTTCAVIGGAIGSLLGPVGTIIGGLIGSVVGEFIGNFIGNLMCLTLFGNPTAKGPGAPPMGFQQLGPPRFAYQPLGPPSMALQPLPAPMMNFAIIPPPIFGLYFGDMD